MLCEQCGVESPDDNLFCVNCGARLCSSRRMFAESAVSADTVGVEEGQSASPEQASSTRRQQDAWQTPPPQVQDEYDSDGRYMHMQPSYYDPRREPLSVWGCLWTLALSVIPLVNIVFLVIWSFAGGVNVNRRNFARAYLILLLALTGFCAVTAIIGLVVSLSQGWRI